MSAKAIIAALVAGIFTAYVAAGLLSLEMAMLFGIPAAVAAAIGLTYASRQR